MKYGVRLIGENFELELDGKIDNYGFITTRFVKAKNNEEAELKAVELVKSDQRLNEALIKNRSYEPMVYLEEIWEEKWWKRLGGHGYGFYPMASET
ncbi:hypothetical protein ORJ04_22820 [Rheinheimera baltica]|uniref:Uncharacterized protein n=1 Tax=Rheinheimera baltica TaxID=67576 RepID=A0ABT9I6S1_9GAMM|nr:hypothetical protein [Rheinheimera baltica]MDP5138783.1 hypothetical protein [Rheinheimera baltica]MDP5151339.1 hypothetical protein [Rheinheimera baltica]